MSVMLSVDRSVTPNTGYVGDVFTYRVVVHHNVGDTVALVPSGGVYGSFEARQVQKTTHPYGQGVVTEFTALVSVFDTGFQVVPSQTVTVKTGDQVTTFSVTSVSVPIQSLLTSASPTPNPLKEPMNLRLSWGLYIGTFLVILFAIAMCVMAYRFFRKRFQKVVAVLEPVDPRSAYDKALEALGILEKEDLAKTGDFKAHYLRLSDLLKTLFSDVYGVPVLEMTTDEVIDCLSRRLVLDKIHVVRDILETGDLVKFAKSIPELPVHYDVLVKARMVVEWFRPLEEKA